MLASRHIEERGFSLEDGIVLIGALLQLNPDSESTILEAAYRSQRLRVQSNVNRGTLIKVLDDHMVRWMIGADAESLKILQNSQSLVEESSAKVEGYPELRRKRSNKSAHKRGDTIFRRQHFGNLSATT